MTRDVWEVGNTGIRIPILKDLTEFLETYCEEEVGILAAEFPERVSLYINYNDISTFSEGLLRAIETNFYTVSTMLVNALLDTKAFVLRSGLDEELDTISKNVKIRIVNVPTHYKQKIRDIGKNDTGKLVCVDGYARNVADRCQKLKRAAFECMRCGHVNYVDQPGLKYEEPFAGCEDETCGKKGPFNLDMDLSEWIDYQRIQIQELPDTSAGARTQDIIIECEEDLTNFVMPGDRITVTGVIVLRQQSGKDGKKNIFDKVIEAISIEKMDIGFDEYVITSTDEERILELSRDPDLENKLRQSIAPSIHGYETVKEAIIYQQFSGIQKFLPDGTKLRGDIHVALIGDPGGAKTQLLKWAVKVSPRGIYTSGKTSSTAGLTAAVTRDKLNDDKFTVEGGAAVMANNGLLAIDEIGQAREEDKSALHEVMEQQTVSIAKAGNVITLSAKCGLLIAGNPDTGYFDRHIGYAVQINLPPALWSRIDLMFLVLDTPEEKKDMAISDHILRNHRIGGMIQNREHSKTPAFTDEEVKNAVEEIKAPIDDEFLRLYIAYARRYVFPVTPYEVSCYIRDFYLDVRSLKMNDPDCPVPITARSVEAIQRLAEAHARMKLSEVVTYEDVDAAKMIIASCLKEIGMDGDNRLDANLQNGGMSKCQLDKIRWLNEAIKSEKYLDEICNKMRVLHNVEREEVESLIKHLKTKGKIWDIRGEYKTVQ